MSISNHSENDYDFLKSETYKALMFNRSLKDNIFPSNMKMKDVEEHVHFMIDKLKPNRKQYIISMLRNKMAKITIIMDDLGDRHLSLEHPEK